MNLSLILIRFIIGLTDTSEVPYRRRQYLPICNCCITLDSYMFNSENLSLTIMSPLTPPSPLRGEGKGEGKISNIFG